MDGLKRALWEERFKDQASSGITVEAWCSEHQITRYTYYYWKKRIGKTDMEAMAKNTSVPMFAKLKMPPAPSEKTLAAGLIIKWRGFELILSDPNDIALAAQFIRQISQS